MAAKKKAKRKAPATKKRKAKRRKATKKRKAKRTGRDRFSQLTATHAKATATGDTTTAGLIKRELTKGKRRRARR